LLRPLAADPIGTFKRDAVDADVEFRHGAKNEEVRNDGSYQYCNHLRMRVMIQARCRARDELKAPDVNAIALRTSGFRVEQVLFGFDQSCNLACPSCGAIESSKRSLSEENAALSRPSSAAVAHSIP